MDQQHWNTDTLTQLFELPFMELMFHAQSVHRQHFPVNEMEICTLLSIKTGGCPEDCAYCPQSAHYDTGLGREKLWDLKDVLAKAQAAKASGAVRFCMGAAWRSPPENELPRVLEMIVAVKGLGLETCVTLGMLTAQQAQQLSDAGLDYYNHNLDTSPQFYNSITTTRTYQDRLATLQHVHDAGINICCGGIIGMGESREDRIALLLQLTKLPGKLKSIPINHLIPISGTPLENMPKLDNFEFIRTIAATRIIKPATMIRLSAGREWMSDEMQTLCFMAGANSIFCGDKLLTMKNPDGDADTQLLNKLGFSAKANQSAEYC